MGRSSSSLSMMMVAAREPFFADLILGFHSFRRTLTVAPLFDRSSGDKCAYRGRQSWNHTTDSPLPPNRRHPVLHQNLPLSNRRPRRFPPPLQAQDRPTETAHPASHRVWVQPVSTECREGEGTECKAQEGIEGGGGRRRRRRHLWLWEEMSCVCVLLCCKSFAVAFSLSRPAPLYRGCSSTFVCSSFRSSPKSWKG